VIFDILFVEAITLFFLYLLTMKTKFGDKLASINDALLRKKLRTCIVLATLAALILSSIVIIKFPDTVESMSKAIESTELDPPLNDGRHNKHGDVFLYLAFIAADILFINFVLRSKRVYKIRHGYNDGKLLRERKLLQYVRLWITE
jgi:hypothetical protein